MSIHGVLGQTTSYPKTYDPNVLYAIPRTMGRDDINFDADKLAMGVDWWHAFEVSWLNEHGVSQVAVARFTVPASSVNIIESKSLKLYLNSLNFTEFANWQTVQETVTRDLSACAQSDVTVELFGLESISDNSGLLIDTPKGHSIDKALNNLPKGQKLPLFKHPNPSLLNGLDGVNSTSSDSKSDNMQPKSYQLYTNLLRSNCPVTNQPDWGRVAIDITTSKVVNEANLLAYILSYRQHNGFHEQCVEQIFADLSTYFEPSALMARAWYTRRGGIDINPCRVSDIKLLPKPSRLVRQ